MLRQRDLAMLVRSPALHDLRARDRQAQPEDILRQRFAAVLNGVVPLDARFIDTRRQAVLGAAAAAAGPAPLVAQLLADPDLYRYLRPLWGGGRSVLVRLAPDGGLAVFSGAARRAPERAPLPEAVAAKLAAPFSALPGWPGTLNAEGHHILDPRSPAPGPHFFTNLLLGNRIGFARPLQTTPKSVVDHLGRGSFRSHAATQVLATRCDLRAEENGFPANRQCYLVEDGRQIFYSADPGDPNVLAARTIQAQNRTIITYRTRCALEITRTIFLLPAEEGLPLATEVHSILVRNHGSAERHLRLVVAGMFGPAAPNALWEDVLYSNVSMQGRLLQNADGAIVAISPHYHPRWTKGDERCHTMIVHQGGRTYFPTEFSTSYNEFVGQGTLERPQGLSLLSNRLARKGPGFFALAVPLTLPPGESARADNFTSLVSGCVDPQFGEHSLLAQVEPLVARFSPIDAVPAALAAQLNFFDHFRQHLQVESGDPAFDSFVNHNLPFQILYQTFVSRSFDQTQKGYREIGFREVQDLFASMPFFIAMGRRQLVQELLLEWAGQIYQFGYANHNFYWQGKEPGDFSDDALWFVQAVDIYLNLTGHFAFLDQRCPIAGRPEARRTIYEAIQAVLRYSSEISVGRHGLPLLDRADWNDTLRLDPDYLNGPQKEEAYRRQLAAGGRPGEPLASDNCESVMNAFLLQIALDATHRFALRRGDTAYAAHLADLGRRLRDRLQRDTWKENFFARVLINRGGRYRYLGAKGDALSADANLDGTYFLNSFSWAVLAGVATQEQIRTMLRVMQQALLTPHGLKLCSPVAFAEITSRGGSAEYFPGDRENGGVFKHADMMAAVALFKAAKTVPDAGLAAELRDLAYDVIDVVLPYRTLENPYLLAGNPRFCTQYNNSETGENVGPTLSGTAPWLWLALLAGYGIQVRPEGIELDPLLRDRQTSLEIRLHTGRAGYHIRIAKPRGFSRRRDHQPRLTVDGAPLQGTLIPHFADGAWHDVALVFPPLS